MPTPDINTQFKNATYSGAQVVAFSIVSLTISDMASRFLAASKPEAAFLFMAAVGAGLSAAFSAHSAVRQFAQGVTEEIRNANAAGPNGPRIGG